MITDRMTDEDRRILSIVLPECFERKQGWECIGNAITCMLDSFRIHHRKFTIHGVSFERVDVTEYYQYVKATKNGTEYKCSWMLPFALHGLYIDPNRCDF